MAHPLGLSGWGQLRRPRAASSAYALDSHLVTSTEEVVEGDTDLWAGNLGLGFPDRAYARRRAARQVYWFGVAIAAGVEPAESDPEAQHRLLGLPDRAYRRPRAARVAYWYATDRENIAQEPVGENPLPEELLVPALPDRAHGFLLAHDLAYEFINFPPPEAGDVTSELLERLLPDKGLRARRLRSGVYQLITEIAVEEGQDIVRAFLPERAYRRRRAMRDVYWLDARMALEVLEEVVEQPIEVASWLMPERADRRPRAGSRAYTYVEFWVDVDLEGVPEERRKKKTTHWMRN